MKLFNYRVLLLGISVLSLLFISSCKEDEEPQVANEISRSGDAEVTVTEGEGTGTVTVTYSFAVPARKDGTITVNAVTQNLTYGTNYTTTPAESSGTITVNFTAGSPTVSFTVAVNDDAVNLPDGSVTFTLASITGETANISPTNATFKLTIIDNEGESIILSSTDLINLGDVVPGTNTDAKEVTFTTLNVVSDMTVTASTGFAVSATTDGTYGSTATLAPTATSFFVRAAPAAGAALGELTGTATISVAQASAVADLRAVVANSVGVLFWVENFNYPSDDTYPPYVDTYPNVNAQENWGILPVSARLRATANYNGTDASFNGLQGITRPGNLDTWYLGNRFYGIAMGDGPLSVTGYPGSGVGRTARLKQDYSNQTSRASTAASNPCGTEGEFASKNTLMLRRFVENGQEITSGTVYVSAMVKVNEVFDEATPVLKNAVFMVTGDAGFVNTNAMKLNIRNDGAGGFNFGVSKSADDGSVVYGNNSYQLGTTYAVIMKIEIKPDLVGEDPNDEVSVYVYKDGDAIPTFETGTAVPEAKIDVTNQNVADVHDVTTGLETFFFREVADVFAAGGPTNVKVHDVEFSGIRIATSWSALFLNAASALHDSTPSDPLQTKNYGQIGCLTVGGPQKLGNNDQ